MIEGHPDAWVDGHLYRLNPGDVVAFPPGTGIGHTFINNTQDDVRLLVVGDTDQPEDRGCYPLNPELHTIHSKWWEDAPRRPLGPHDGRPDQPS